MGEEGRINWKTNTNKSDSFVYSADLQKILLLPRLPAHKEALFTRGLVTFNFTVALAGMEPKKKKSAKNQAGETTPTEERDSTNCSSRGKRAQTVPMEEKESEQTAPIEGGATSQNAPREKTVTSHTDKTDV